MTTNSQPTKQSLLNNPLLDKTIKVILRAIHIVSFAIAYGIAYYGVVYGGEESKQLHIIIAVWVSGILMIVREQVKNKEYLRQTRGILTLIKIVILLSISLLPQYSFYILTVVLIFGILASHLPKHIRKRKLI